MTAISRRQFFRTTTHTALAGVLAARATELRPSPFGWPIGCQTFPVGKMIDEDFPGTMKQLGDAGFQRIELCSPFWYGEHNFGFGALAKLTGSEIRRVLGDHGLQCESSHVDMTELRGEKLPKTIAWAKDLGLTQMIVPSLDGPQNATLDQVKALADEYNNIGEQSRRAGIQQGLHTEGFELSMVDGRRVFDRLFELLDPQLVKFQFQMSTISSGLVAADYFTSHPGRFLSMHLQDLDMNAPVPPPPAPPPGTPAGRGGRGGRRPPKPIGQGSIDWVKTFNAAKTGGVKNYFVEMSLDLMKASVPYLRDLKV
jgi:sugar phosphate isomerase/epimerase